MESIPVTFLCAIHRAFGDFERDGVIVDAPDDSFMSKFVIDSYTAGLRELTVIPLDELPDKPGLYRYDGIATPAEHTWITDYYEFTGEFAPIQRCIDFI